jgi:CheY-like chemotaxis protein
MSASSGPLVRQRDHPGKRPRTSGARAEAVGTRLRECIESALDLVAPAAADKGLDVAYTIDDATPTALLGDATRIRQILVNLLGNAVKFTPRGEVVVSASATHRAGRSYDVELAVRDTGIGIPADCRDRLFHPFGQIAASATRRCGGTGLGLVIGLRLAELMGGTITAESEVGKGSTFRVTFVGAAVADPSALSPHREEPRFVGKRLLVVDDNRTNLRIVEHQTSAWGMIVSTAASGREALARLADGEAFDAAILDVCMPEMDGLTLARAIRRYAATRRSPSSCSAPSVGARSRARCRPGRRS